MPDALESLYVYLTRSRRDLRVDAPAVCVGGSTLGGTGKTPLAIAIAADLARRGARVALVGHAYGARPRRARVVSPSDAVAEVGDEAIVCARALEAAAEVIVAPSRQEAIDLAERRADVLVLDGVLQLMRRRARLSVLTTPNGDAPTFLSRVADRVACVRPEMVAPWEELARARVGLITCLARPARIVRGLAARGVVPVVHHALRDHGPASSFRPRGADVWVATEKCALHISHPVVRLSLRLDPSVASPYADAVAKVGSPREESVVMLRT